MSWEFICSEQPEDYCELTTSRLRTEHGYLYRVTTAINTPDGLNAHDALYFVPDPPLLQPARIEHSPTRAALFTDDGLSATVYVFGKPAVEYALSIPFDLTTAIRRK